ncbi:MAG: hypothetical protein C4B59_13315 [Candidatus Methanogaster sp.]|uniref:Uncharacterized protein n=1 Tax=Candidatus Methanogaster sp. TaxID=3386292 RepID=A0AC61KZY1_9EURY|nr:MAG: hypothetical protein C4B59_13315 [ANME-2 cluster archaeon]
MSPTAINIHGDAICTIHTARKTIRQIILLMARSSVLCGVDDRVKHACTIGYSIPPITFGFPGRQALAIRCVSSGPFRTQREVVGVAK